MDAQSLMSHESLVDDKPRRRLTDAMPEVAAWIAEMRTAFGTAEVNASIRAGMNGKPTFYAKEGGIVTGTPAIDDRVVWHRDGLVDRLFCLGCNGECVGNQRCSEHRKKG